MLGMILMGLVFAYALAGCVILYAIMTAQAEPEDKPSRERLEYLIQQAKRRRK